MKFIVDDRVLGRKEEVHFDTFQSAWSTLFSKVCGCHKVITWTMNGEGDDLIIIHDYLKKSEV